jgi:hypothetical protein
MRSLPLIITLISVNFLGCSPPPTSAPSSAPRANNEARPQERAPSGSVSECERVLRRAFEQRTSNVQVEGRGAVKRTLPDDNNGSRHQRFILELGSGQTILVAHNVDIAPRIPRLQKGDEVAFRGEYEWSPQGGAIHWTHHDPNGRHSDGWLKHKDKIYQ